MLRLKTQLRFVVDLFWSKVDALRSKENSAKHIEFCSNEICKCVSTVNATTDRVDSLVKGFVRLEAQIASKPSSSSGDLSMAECRILGSVLSRIDEDWKKRMSKEDRHSFHTYESQNSSVQKLDLDLTSLREKGRSAAGTAAASFCSGESGGGGMLPGGGYGGLQAHRRDSS